MKNLMFHIITTIKIAIGVVLIITLNCSPDLLAQSANTQPLEWNVNCNGYKGQLLLKYNALDDKVNGTLLGTPVEGYLVDRHMILHRFPQGRTQIWDGWIMDPQLGAHGQSYYDAQLIIAGTCSEANGRVDGVYPWYGTALTKGNTGGGTGIIPTGGLVVNYPLNGNLNDVSGNGFHGQAQGNIGYAMGLTTQVVNLGNPGNSVNCGKRAAFEFNSAFTLSAWIKGTNFGPSRHNNTIIGNEDWVPPRGNTFGYTLRTGGGILSFVMANSAAGSSWVEVYSKSIMKPNIWYHVAATYSPGAMDIYINGQRVGNQKIGPIRVDYTSIPLLIGMSPNRSERREFNGMIDGVRIYNRSLSQPEIEQIYLAKK